MKLESRIEVCVTHMKRYGYIYSLPTNDYDYYTINLDIIIGLDNGLVDLPRESFQVIGDIILQ